MSSEVLFWRWVETALGPMVVAGGARGVCYVGLPRDERNEPRDARAALELWRARRAPRSELSEAPRELESLALALEGWAGGRVRPFGFALDLRGSDFERAVWRAELAIPWGETRTYAEIARAIGRPGASRAVGGATGRNPVPVLVPCHRVVAADGPGGFGGGLALKARMLALEGVRLPERNPRGPTAVSTAWKRPKPEPRARAAGSPSSSAASR